MLYYNKNLSVHACAIVVNSVGILLAGNSGIGKSDLILKLLDRGHIFIADDLVVVYADNQCHNNHSSDYYITSYNNYHNQENKYYLYIESLGVINVNKYYSNHQTTLRHKLDLIINLMDDKEYSNITKIQTNDAIMQGASQEPLHYQNILGKLVPQFNLVCSSNRPLELIIEIMADYYKNSLHQDTDYKEFLYYHQRLITT